MKKRICLNADVGELPGEQGRQLDRMILDVVTRCSIACGGHAGDEKTMEMTIDAACARGVLVGAHPAYPDREGFGRSRTNVSDVALETSLINQVQLLSEIARRQAVSLAHVKPHGSLYNDGAKDRNLADLVVRICRLVNIPTLIGPPGSALEVAAHGAGLSYVAEAFADRSYEADGHLTPRTLEGAVLTDKERQLSQVIGLVEQGEVLARTGERVSIEAQTICLHGDTPGAAKTAAALREALLARGIRIEA